MSFASYIRRKRCGGRITLSYGARVKKAAKNRVTTHRRDGTVISREPPAFVQVIKIKMKEILVKNINNTRPCFIEEIPTLIFELSIESTRWRLGQAFYRKGVDIQMGKLCKILIISLSYTQNVD